MVWEFLKSKCQKSLFYSENLLQENVLGSLTTSQIMDFSTAHRHWELQYTIENIAKQQRTVNDLKYLFVGNEL